MARQLAWGIISTGSIAKTFAKGLAASKTGQLLAVASRAQEKADAFGAEFGVERALRQLRGAARRPGRAGRLHRHAAPHARRVGDQGRRGRQAHPLREAPRRQLRRGDGHRRGGAAQRRLPHGSVHVPLPPADREAGRAAAGRRHRRGARHPGHLQLPRRLQTPKAASSHNDLGGGGILDVGCYSVSMARLVAGVAARASTSPSPSRSKASATSASTGVDEWAVAVLKFPGDIVAQVSTGVRVKQDNCVRIFGSEGNIFVPSPWFPAREGGTTQDHRQAKGRQRAAHVEMTTDAVALRPRGRHRRRATSSRRQAPFPAMTWDDTLGNMRTLDRWREAIGLVYDMEKPENVRRAPSTAAARRPPALPT